MYVMALVASDIFFKTTKINREETRCSHTKLWGGGGGNYLHAQIHLRFRHAHHETKDQLSGQAKDVLYTACKNI